MEPWPNRLAVDSEDRESSLEELRLILMRGLRAGLSGRAGSDEAFMEDVTQESLLKIVAHLDTFEGRGKFTSWAIAIALRVAFNELRRREWKNVSLDEIRERQGALPEEREAGLDPGQEAERRSLREFLKTIIETDLTQRQRDVLLCELNGMPQEEIARQLDTNRNNLYKIFHDARRALRKALELRGADKSFFFEGGQQEQHSNLEL